MCIFGPIGCLVVCQESYFYVCILGLYLNNNIIAEAFWLQRSPLHSFCHCTFCVFETSSRTNVSLLFTPFRQYLRDDFRIFFIPINHPDRKRLDDHLNLILMLRKFAIGGTPITIPFGLLVAGILVSSRLTDSSPPRVTSDGVSRDPRLSGSCSSRRPTRQAAKRV